MNSFEVINCLLRGKQAPRVGFNDSIWKDILELWKNEGYLMELKRRGRKVCRSLRAFRI